MKLGEKLQQLRRQSGLSQEQLAARLTVSRQAVSKWELDESMPDTENVLQLSRLFGVSCDYLLRDEVEEPDAALPNPQTKEQAASADPGNGGASAAPGDRHSPSANDRSGDASAAPGDRHSPSANDRSGGASAAHLDEQGWTHNAFVLSLWMCAMGLAVAFIFYRINGHTVRPLAIGFTFQLLGVVLFELSTPRMGSGRNPARMRFYMAACWLVFPNLVCLVLGWGFEYLGWTGSPLRAIVYWFVLYLLLCLTVTAVLLLLLRRQRAKT